MSSFFAYDPAAIPLSQTTTQRKTTRHAFHVFMNQSDPALVKMVEGMPRDARCLIEYDAVN